MTAKTSAPVVTTVTMVKRARSRALHIAEDPTPIFCYLTKDVMLGPATRQADNASTDVTMKIKSYGITMITAPFVSTAIATILTNAEQRSAHAASAVTMATSVGEVAKSIVIHIKTAVDQTATKMNQCVGDTTAHVPLDV